MKIVIPELLPIDPTSRQAIVDLGAEIYQDVPDRAGYIKRVAEAEIITALHTEVDAEIIDAATKLKYIIVPAVGYEWIDIGYARRKAIQVSNCPTFNSRAVAEHAIGLMFTAARRIVDYQAVTWAPLAEAHASSKRVGRVCKPKCRHAAVHVVMEKYPNSIRQAYAPQI